MRKHLIVALAMGAVISSVAFADDEETSSTTTVEAKVKKTPISVMYGGIYSGGSLGNPLAAESPSGIAEMAFAQLVNNVVFASYKVSDDFIIGPRFEFNYQLTEGQNISLLDFAIRAMRTNLIQAGDFNLAADVRMYLPTTQASQNFGILAGLRTTQYASYRFSGTRWKLSTASFIWANFFNSHNVLASGAYRGNLDWYFAPTLTYQLNPKLAFVWTYEMWGNTQKGESIFTSNIGAPDLQTGVSYDFTDNFNLSPFIEIYPTQAVDIKHAKIGMYITAKLI